MNDREAIRRLAIRLAEETVNRTLAEVERDALRARIAALEAPTTTTKEQ